MLPFECERTHFRLQRTSKFCLKFDFLLLTKCNGCCGYEAVKANGKLSLVEKSNKLLIVHLFYFARLFIVGLFCSFISQDKIVSVVITLSYFFVWNEYKTDILVLCSLLCICTHPCGGHSRHAQ